MDRNKRLVKNTLVYFIGSFSSKLLYFLLLPLYTSFLTPEDYGKVDLIITYTSILIPLFTLQISFAGLRFLFETEKEEKRRNIISNTFFVSFMGMLFFCLLYCIFWTVTKYEYGIYVILYVLLNNISSTFQQIIRGLKKNILYAVTGAIGTTVQLLSTVMFILGLGLKSLALILAPIVSCTVIVLIIVVSTDIIKFISIRSIDINGIKRMIKYSIPLVPDAICWWILLGFGRIFLNYSHGTEAVGIYAVADKFPGIFTMVYSIFNSAWQENSFSEYNKQDRDEYYSKMYNGLIRFLFPIIILAIPMVKIMLPLILSKDFNSAYLYIPILLLGSLISILSTFYGSGFESAKQTNGIMVSTFVAMFTNILLNVTLVPNYGVFGVSIAFVFSYVALLLMRLTRSKKFFKIKVDKKFVLISSFFLIISLVVYYIDNILFQLIVASLGVIYFILVNYYLLERVLNKFIRGRLS